MSDKTRGLGRGLAALIEQSHSRNDVQTQVQSQNNSSLKLTSEIPIEFIHANPDQPRRYFDELDLEELTQSIKEKGILQPIIVRPSSQQAEHFEIVAGERRWRASQRAGLLTLPVVIKNLNDLEGMEIAIIENVQRADLNAIEEARSYRVLMDRYGRTQESLSKIVGKSRSYIANLLRLLNLSEPLQDMVFQGQLSAGHARALLTARHPEALAKTVVQQALSVRQTESLVQQDTKSTNFINKLKHQKSTDTQDLEIKLSQILGLKVIINDNNGKGDIKLVYNDIEQLDDVTRKLMAN